MTILKNTTKLVSDVAFPALTVCGSGLHLNNVEKKLIWDFENWRRQENRVETNREAIYKDTEEFMQTRFQIKPSKSSGEQPISILEILDTMIAPNADASLAASSVRQNAMACQKSTEIRNDPCTYSCSNPSFNISGSKCFHVSTTKLNYDAAKSACQDNWPLSADPPKISWCTIS